MSLSSSTKMVNSEQKPSGLNFAKIWDRFGMLMVFAGLFLLCSLFVPYFALRDPLIISPKRNHV